MSWEESEREGDILGIALGPIYLATIISLMILTGQTSPFRAGEGS